MPRYDDPLGTLSFDLPAGWVLDPFGASLTRLAFIHWNEPEAALLVQLRPPRLPTAAPAADWRALIAAELPPEAALVAMPCPVGEALAAERHGRVWTRVAFVRGLRLEAVVEHWRPHPADAQAESALAAMSLLPRVLASLHLPAESAEPPAQPLDGVAQCQAAALQAIDSGATDAAQEALQRGLALARSHWLASLVSDRRSPDLRAAQGLVSLLVGQAGLSGDPLPARAAEWLSMRSAALLPTLGVPRALQAPLVEQWHQIRHKCALLQARQMNLPQGPDDLLPQALLDARGGWLLTQAQAALAQRDLARAARLAGAAADDLLLALAKRRRQQVQPEAQAMVEWQGHSIRRADLIEGLCRPLAELAASAVHITYLQAMDRQDSRAARDAAELVLALSHSLLAAEPRLALQRATAVAEMALAGALLFAADAVNLARADALMDSAIARIEALPEPDLSLQAEAYRNKGWICHYRRQATAGAGWCAKGLAALDALQAARTAAQAAGQPAPGGGRDDDRMRRALASLHSQFLLHEGDLVQAEAQAREAVQGLAQPISSNLLNLALVLDKAGRRGEALAELRRAFEVALSDNPLGQDVLRLLFVASAWLEPEDRAAALALHAATESLRDVQRLQLDTPEQQVAFDEEAHHLEVAQSLVGRLIAADDLGGALAAADRSRARILVELLGGDMKPPRSLPPERAHSLFGRPGGTEAPPAEVDLPPLPSPPTLSADPATALREAGAHVQACAARALAALGAPPPLDVPGIMATVQAAGRPALIVQPERGQVQLFCVLPEGGVIVATSPVDTDTLAAAAAQAQAALGVFATARSRAHAARGERLVLADIDDDQQDPLDEALDTLSSALIEPLAGLLSDNGLLARVIGPRGLIIVPYRELALVPWALLRVPGGGLLVEQGPLVQVPSLAALAVLQRRPARRGRRSALVGEPALDAAQGLEPLPAAAAEARGIAALLREAGTAEADIALRLGAEATEPAYRADAAEAALVHLSCHAALREPASRSALYLAPGPRHDGLLLPHEIAEVRLDHALVYLSACQTGLGRPTADGVIGLGRAFFAAGAQAVLLSMWRVVDAAAWPLAERFYRAWLGLDGRPAVDAASALQQAMLAVREELRAGRILTEHGEALDDHPAHWAPFMLAGDGTLCFDDHG